MDWTLWDPASDQAAQESNYCNQDWQCDFYFGYGLDVIEESALNEKSSIQVLRILITKADNEILELEEDLVILQSQLALADNEWSELCCAALKEKIESLDIAIQRLKNGSVHSEDEFENCVQIPREPAERIHDILEALLRGYFQQKVDTQSLEVIAEESSSDHSAHATKLLEEEKRSRNSASNTIRNEEFKEMIATNAEKQLVSKTLLKPQGNKTNLPGTAKPPNLVLNSTLNVDKEAIGHKRKERALSRSNLEINIESPAKLSSIRTTTSASVLDLSVKTERRKTGVEDREKLETAVVKYSCPHDATACNVEKRPRNIDPVTIKETEIKALCSRSIILKPSLDLEGKGTKTSETVKPADTTLDLRKNAVKEANEDSNSNPKQSKEPEAACSNNIATSSLKKYERRITSTGRRRVTNLLLELPNHQKENITKPRSKMTQRLLPSQVQETEVCDTDEETNSDSSIKPQRRLMKRTCHLTPEELGLVLNSSSHKIYGFSRSKNGVIKEEKRDQLGLCGARDVKLSLVSMSQKKRKICRSSTKELTGLDISLASTTKEGRWVAECHMAVESAIETVKLLPSPNVVEYLTLVELRAIGKQQKVKGYYKLRKAELAEKLGLEIHGRGRSKGKGNGTGILSIIQGGTKTEIRTIEDKDSVEGKALACPQMLKEEEEREHHMELVTC